MERFKPPGPADELTVVASCAWCGEDIYTGDAVMRIDGGGYVHDDDNCVVKYAVDWTYDACGTLNGRGDIG